MPIGKTVQIFDFTNEWILKDSWPFRISTSILPSLVVLSLLFTNRVKFIFFLNSFFKIALIGLSFLVPKRFSKYGYTKNLKQAAVERGFPGRPNSTFCFPKIFPNKIGLPGLMATPLKYWDN